MDAATYFKLPGHPVPEILPEWAPFFDGCRDGSLRIETCRDCGRTQHFPRGQCMRCGGAVDHVAAAGQGTIESVTTVSYTKDAFFRTVAPYHYALIRLPERVKMTGLILGDAPQIDERVVARFGELSEGSGVWGVVWELDRG